MIYKISQKSRIKQIWLFSQLQSQIQQIYTHNSISTRLQAFKQLPLSNINQLNQQLHLPNNPLITPPNINLTTAKQLLFFHKNNKTKQNLVILHSLAFIQFNAFQAYTDTLLRFAYSKQHQNICNTMKQQQLKQFRQQIRQIAIQQGQHCMMLIHRLQQLNCKFGQFPVISNLANMVNQTTNDILQRLAVISIVNQGRGMKSIQKLINKVMGCQDKDRISAQLLKKIEVDQVKHFSVGLNWFKYFCRLKYHMNSRLGQHQANKINKNNGEQSKISQQSYMKDIIQNINNKYKTKITKQDLQLPKIKSKKNIYYDIIE